MIIFLNLTTAIITLVLSKFKLNKEEKYLTTIKQHEFCLMQTRTVNNVDVGKTRNIYYTLILGCFSLRKEL
jgi:hypothetical protein